MQGRQPRRRQLLGRKSELPLFDTAAWVGHLENLLEPIDAAELAPLPHLPIPTDPGSLPAQAAGDVTTMA